MSAKRLSRPKIDQEMKGKMLIDRQEGLSEDQIADKYSIHVEYVRRAIKAARSSMDHLTVASPVTSSTPQRTPPEKKIKTKHEFEPQRRGSKRKASEDMENSDVDMEDVSSTVPVSLVSGITPVKVVPSKRSLGQSMTQAVLNETLTTKTGTRASTRKANKQTSAVIVTANAITSPFKETLYEVSVQTESQVLYDQEYIDFLKKSHEQIIETKDQEINELKRRLVIVEKQLQQTRAELVKEKERIGLEKGWKKHF